MSKIKSPDEKKRKSYESDCRNTYGENSKASRKNIPRSKQRGHMTERHAVAESLRGLSESPSDEEIESTESETKVKSKQKRLSAFKKSPDKPLGEYLERRVARKERRERDSDAQ